MKKSSNSKQCFVCEYPLKDLDINFATAQVQGRYPDKGFCCNKDCKELIFIIKGEGVLNLKDSSSVEFKAKDVILIEKGEIYHWDAHCEMLISCTPAWYSEQYRLVD